MKTDKVIEFADVSFGYGGDESARALDGVSFEIARGEFVAIMGANGSGKSSIAKLVDGLIHPDSGTVKVFGIQPVTEQDIFDIRKRIGFVFQDPDDQFVASIVEDEVAFAPENLGLPSEVISQRVDEALSSVGLSELRQCDVNMLSGGQKQRVAIADALALRPDILILDEATSMLDERAAVDLLALTDELHREGMTIVMITHRPAEAKRAERLLVMRQGTVAFDGSPSAYEAQIGWPALPTKGQLQTQWPVPTRSEDDMAALTFDNVSFSYEEDEKGKGEEASPKTWILHDLSFALRVGEIAALMGPNGSGKSTALKMTNGLLQPNAGCILVHGRDITAKNEANAARLEVGLCFQYPEKQLFATTVFEDVSFGPKHMKLSEEEVRTRVEEALGAVQLDPAEFGNRSPFTLSGGEQRRVAIAGVLAMRPSILVMDEPSAGLDIHGHASLMELLAKLRAQGLSVLIATHDQEEAVALADQIIRIDRDPS